MAEERCSVYKHALAVDIQLLNPLHSPDWDRFATVHPDATPFHSAAWARVLSRTYRHEPVYLHCSLHGALVALVPMMEVRSRLTGCRGVCLPFTDFCDPLIFKPFDFGPVLDKLASLGRARKWKYFELRGKHPLEAPALPAVTFYGHTLDLRGSTEQLFARFTSPVRRAIRKAERSGLRVEVRGTRETVLDFYRLHIRTRRRHGLPPQPRSFFLNIYEELIAPGAGFIALVRTGSRAVAAAVFFRRGTEAVYKFGASDDAFQELRGNNLAMWAGIKQLAAQGVENLHFGRTSLGNEGLRRFKLGWGTKEETISYFRYNIARHAWTRARDKASGLHNAVFRSLPLAVNRLAGALIYPHLD